MTPDTTATQAFDKANMLPPAEVPKDVSELLDAAEPILTQDGQLNVGGYGWAV